MVVLAHAADFLMFGPVVAFVLWVSIRSLLAQRRERDDRERVDGR
jgi:hypothetical protein